MTLGFPNRHLLYGSRRSVPPAQMSRFSSSPDRVIRHHFMSHKPLLRLFSLLVAGWIALSVSSAPAQSVGNYAPVVRTTGITYTSIQTTGTSVTGWLGSGTNDNRSTPQPIGFPFIYNGQTYSTFSISTNGFMDFSSSTANGSSDGPYGRNNSEFSSAGGTLLVLAPLYDDLDVRSGSSLDSFKYLVTGSSGSRVLIVQWNRLRIPTFSGHEVNLQVKLYEGTGIIEFLYGLMTAGSGVWSYTTGINGSSMSAIPTVEELLTQQTPNTTTFNNTPSNALSTIPASNTKLTFTPPAPPTAPTNLTITSVTSTGMTVGWTDASTSEISFSVLHSTDGVNFLLDGNILSTTTGSTGTTYSLQLNGLIPSTLYFLRVAANTEGSASVLSGSQTTLPPDAIISIASGNWSDPAIWNVGHVPTQFDDVTIADGHSVTIDTAATCKTLAVGQGTSGVLQYESAVARTLTVTTDIVIAPGGTFQSAATGSVTSHLLSLAGNLTNNGTLAFSTNSNAAGAGITFTGATNNTLSGTGPTTDVRTITINKGTSRVPVLELTPSNFTVWGSSTDGPGSAFLSLTNGTFKISGTFAGTHRLFSNPNYTIPVTAGIWLNNPSFVVAGINGSPTVAGLLRITQGTYNVGTRLGDSMSASTSAAFLIEGGTFNLADKLGTTATISYTQSGGTVNVTTVGNASPQLGGFHLSSFNNNILITGGSIVLNRPSNAMEFPLDYKVYADPQSSISGGTLQVGNSSTPAGSHFHFVGLMPNLHITNTSSDRTATIFSSSPATTCLNTTIDSGTTLNLNGYVFMVSGPNVINNGTLTGTENGSRLYFLGTDALANLQGSGSAGDIERLLAEDGALSSLGHLGDMSARAVPQTYSGTGIVTSPLSGLSIDNPAGVNMAATNNISTQRVFLFRGTLINSQRVTLGNGFTSFALTRTGSPGSSAVGGNYDVTPTFNLGSGRYLVVYESEGVPRTTGYEMPPGRTLSEIFVSNPNGVTVAGGGIRITDALTLTAGLVHTSLDNLLTLASSSYWPQGSGSSQSFVDGPLAMELNASSSTNLKFAIGKATAYRPLELKSVNTGGVLRTFVAEVFNTPSGGTPLPPLTALDPARYWSLSNTAYLNTSARINLTYGLDDAVVPIGVPRLAQSNTASGEYASLGGTLTETTIESTLDLTPGNDFFTIGHEEYPTITWDGGAGTSNWSDANNWNPDGVPSGTSDILLAGSATTINLDGDFEVHHLWITDNKTLNLGSHNLAVQGNWFQFGGIVNLGSGTLDCKASFKYDGGTFNAMTGTTIFSGTAVQLIEGGPQHFHVVFRNGGLGAAKTLASGETFRANGDFTVESTAQLALTSNVSTTFSVFGNLNYGGIQGGANIDRLLISLRGAGKTINAAGALPRPRIDVPSNIRVVQHNFFTDPALATPTGEIREGKPVVTLLNTYAQKKQEVEALLERSDPTARLVINLDDMTLVRNPASFASLMPISPFEMDVQVIGSYALGDHLSLGSLCTLYVDGRLDCGLFTISGPGALNLKGILGTATTDPAGLGATVLTTGGNFYDDASSIEYNALGDQVVHFLNHPGASRILTAGSGVKTLNGNTVLWTDSGSLGAALKVGSGTTFADGGYRLTFITSGSANVIVNGIYSSTGSGSISYEAGPSFSTIQAVNGTAFGDLSMNFTTSTQPIELNAVGTVDISFRNLILGAPEASGAAGGTLRLNETGTTNVTITGNVIIQPENVSSTGGGFNGTTGTIGTVRVLGNVTSTSTNPTQPIMGNTGTNTLILGGSAPQSLQFAVNATSFTGSKLRIDNSAGVQLGGSNRIYTIAGTLDFLNGNLTTGTNRVRISPTGAVTRTSGHVVGNLEKHVATGAAVLRTFEVGTGTAYAPIEVNFPNVLTAGNLLATTIAGDHPALANSDLDPAQTANRYWNVTNGGVGFTTADVTLHFLPADLDPGANPLHFVVRKYDDPNWSSPITGVVTATSTQATGLTSFSSFAVGEMLGNFNTIMASAGAGGVIVPSGVVLLADGADTTFTITPDTCAVIADVLVDGVSVGAVPTYTFTDVIVDHTIEASFTVTTYTLNAFAVGNGTVSVDPDQTTFSCGATAQITAIADSGYTFSNWTGDATGNENPLTVVMDADKEIGAVFVDVATSVAENLLAPGQTLGIFPNPSAIGATQIVFRVPAAGSVDVSIFDVGGHLVKRLESGVIPSGARAVRWDGRDQTNVTVSAGTYFVRVVDGAGVTSTKRLVLIR